ncbi:tricarboxylic transport membrane protein [Pokkaliibacter plantistimulans]|uniref:Tricarboxylic transport membrane protein n=1 Tax=Pokkaliibacter plantistimulans TaxID=1635171 RepID=A0ABX5LYJ5_9GAMM|nr:tripartite tricarboxylate transporter TctB family protein [Pokkaliibacter plantistimulans]PXF30528.1 tricarboxylic transport membrane protein [Pokkaliibacter plantistimulans]
MLLNNDRIFGMLMLVLAVAYGWGATQLPEPFGGNEVVGPSTFPSILAWILGLCAIYLIVKPDPSQEWPSAKIFGELLVVVVVLLGYAWSLDYLGFILASFACVAILSWRMGATLASAALVGLGTSVGVFLIFDIGLELPLPMGLLGGLA